MRVVPIAAMPIRERNTAAATHNHAGVASRSPRRVRASVPLYAVPTEWTGLCGWPRIGYDGGMLVLALVLGCARPVEAPQELDVLVGFLFAHAMDEDPAELAAGGENAPGGPRTGRAAARTARRAVRAAQRLARRRPGGGGEPKLSFSLTRRLG